MDVGSRVRFHQSAGTPGDPGFIPADTEGEVIAHVEASEDGAGDKEKDVAVIRIGPAEPHGAEGQRHWAIPLDDYAEYLEVI